MAELDLLRAIADTHDSPAAHCRDALRLLRSEGYDFDEAWTLMKRVMARGIPDDAAESSADQVTAWKAVLESQKELWRAAYARMIPPDGLAHQCFEAFDLATG